MKQKTKNWLAFGASMLFMVLLGILAIGTAEAGGYKRVTVNNYYSEHVNVTNVTNLTGVNSKDLATATAIAGAAAAHHFTYTTLSRQASFGGACYDSSSDDCALSFAVAKRYGDALYSGSLSGASNDRMVNFAVGFTF